MIAMSCCIENTKFYWNQELTQNFAKRGAKVPQKIVSNCTNAVQMEVSGGAFNRQRLRVIFAIF